MRTYIVDGQRVTVEREHRKNCPGIQAWDISEACRCDMPLVSRNEAGKRVKRPAEAK